MIYQGQHVKSRNAVRTGGAENMKIFRGKLRNFCNRYIHVVATSKENLTGVFSWL